MDLHIVINDSTAQLIRDRIAFGQNTDIADVVHEALTQLATADRELAELREAVALGDADFAAGRYTRYTPELLDEIFEQAMARVEGRSRVSASDARPVASDQDRQDLVAALKVGLDQAERGETSPWTPTLMSEIFEDAIRQDRKRDARSSRSGPGGTA